MWLESSGGWLCQHGGVHSEDDKSALPGTKERWRDDFAKSRLTLCDSMDWPTRLLCPWDFPGKDTGVECHFLLQGIFLTQGWNPSLPHLQANSLPLSHQRSPRCNLVSSKWALGPEARTSSRTLFFLTTATGWLNADMADRLACSPSLSPPQSPAFSKQPLCCSQFVLPLQHQITSSPEHLP